MAFMSMSASVSSLRLVVCCMYRWPLAYNGLTRHFLALGCVKMHSYSRKCSLHFEFLILFPVPVRHVILKVTNDTLHYALLLS